VNALADNCIRSSYCCGKNKFVAYESMDAQTSAAH